MNIRKDFESAEPLLLRLAGVGAEFARFDQEDWPHLKHREDFGRVYAMPTEQRILLEELYSKGRDCAGFMGAKLREFNDIGKYPSFADYVDSFGDTWAYDQEDLETFIAKVKTLVAHVGQCPWAVSRMIEVFQDQLRLLSSVRHTLDLLKKTRPHLVDKGLAPVNQPQSFSIGSITGKVNINSTDNSTTITIDSMNVFPMLQTAT